MHNDSNFVVDAFDTLINCKTDDDIWLRIHQMLDGIGANHLSVMEVMKADQTFLWFRTSVTDDWREEYLANQYYLASPIIRDGIEKSQAINIRCGDMYDAYDSANMPERKYYQGLKDAGYGELRAQSTSSIDGGTSRFVLMHFEDNKDILSHIDQARVSQTQSLISIFVNKPTSLNTPGMVKLGAHALSPRERDVLGYLSQGMKTAQIAEKLGLAEITVKTHFSSAKKRLNAATREQALVIAMASGAISL